jgi:hypothetical protein
MDGCSAGHAALRYTRELLAHEQIKGSPRISTGLIDIAGKRTDAGPSGRRGDEDKFNASTGILLH